MSTSVTFPEGGNRESALFAVMLSTEHANEHPSSAKGDPATLVSVLTAALRPITHHDVHLHIYTIHYMHRHTRVSYIMHRL